MVAETEEMDLGMSSGDGFGVWDYLVFALMLAVSSAIGLYYRYNFAMH